MRGRVARGVHVSRKQWQWREIKREGTSGGETVAVERGKGDLVKVNQAELAHARPQQHVSGVAADASEAHDYNERLCDIHLGLFAEELRGGEAEDKALLQRTVRWNARDMVSMQRFWSIIGSKIESPEYCAGNARVGCRQTLGLIHASHHVETPPAQSA